MRPINVGILGVGHLTYHMVPGLVAGDTDMVVRLSPRNAERAADLSDRFDLEIAQDNVQLIENSDVVLIGVRQFHAVDVVRGLPWRAGQTVISCCAGLALEELAPLVGEADLVRAMPTVGAEFRESPTCIYPDNASATRVLANCGAVIPLAREHHFNAATVTVCYSSMLFGLLARMQEWNEAAGLDPTTARTLVSELSKSTAVMARERTDVPLDDIVEELATPGSFTLKGLEVLQAHDAFRPWIDMSDKMLKQLSE